MPCEKIIVNGHVEAIVCSRTRRRRCRWCENWAPFLCDGPKPAKKSRTCDAPMCADHRNHVGVQVINGKGDSRDLCPDCTKENDNG